MHMSIILHNLFEYDTNRISKFVLPSENNIFVTKQCFTIKESHPSNIFGKEIALKIVIQPSILYFYSTSSTAQSKCA